jgi:hypothetical protein
MTNGGLPRLIRLFGLSAVIFWLGCGAGGASFQPGADALPADGPPPSSDDAAAAPDVADALISSDSSQTIADGAPALDSAPATEDGTLAAEDGSAAADVPLTPDAPAADVPLLPADGPLDGTAGDRSSQASADGATCGGQGQSCCSDGSCAGGGCCYLGRCVGNDRTCSPSDGTCKNGRCDGCGTAAQKCCGSNPKSPEAWCWDHGFDCITGTCQPCGKKAGPCCLGSLLPSAPRQPACETGTACSSNVCVTCGELGEPCCATGCNGQACCSLGRCQAEGTSCMSARGSGPVSCTAGRCACGRTGEPCCPNGTYSRCDQGNVCLISAGAGSDTTCQACGGLGQPCCTRDPSTILDACAGPAACDVYRDRCVTCGGENQPCCPTTGCGTGLSCQFNSQQNQSLCKR